jgi:hypothetical protein
MSDNTIESANGGPTINTHPVSSVAQYRVHGSIRLSVTVIASTPQAATEAAPAAVRDAFAGMPGAVIPTAGLAVGFPKLLPSAGIQPHRYQVPVTVHGHVQLDDGDNLPDAALDAIADYLDAHNDVTADLSSAVCDDVTSNVTGNVTGNVTDGDNSQPIE